MDIFSIITLFGGLAFFLYGMNVMSDGLEKSTNGSLTKNLTKVTKNRFLAMLFGAGMTIAVQSSSAVTVMLVGLVNSGILKFGQTIGVMMGSNIGTTLTAWILSLAGIDSDVIWLKLLKPANFAPLFALIGIILIMVCKQAKKKSLGNVLIGFAILMFGMTLMSDAMEPLSEMPEFASILTAFKNPILAVIVGAVFTGIIQSSAASVAILQALSLSGGVTYGIAIPIIMGQNIGTCVTALISSIGVSKNAKKVAVVHLSFNIIGTLICLIPFCILNAIFDWAFVDMDISPLMIAIIHSIFNIFTTAVLLPFANQLEKLANFIIKDSDENNQDAILLDDRILQVPSMAVREAFDVAVKMCKEAKDAFISAIGQMDNYDEKTHEMIAETESRSDRYQDQLGTYMMKLSKIGVSESDSKRVARILHSIDDFERISDHALDLAIVIRERYEAGKVFSDEANQDIIKLTAAVRDILELTSKAFEKNDIELAASVEPLEQVIDTMILTAKNKHIARLQSGTCTKELGFSLSDILTNYERVSDHCSNIAVAIIEAYHGSFDTHEYLHAVRAQSNEEFQDKYREYLYKYAGTSTK